MTAYDPHDFEHGLDLLKVETEAGCVEAREAILEKMLEVVATVGGTAARNLEAGLSRLALFQDDPIDFPELERLHTQLAMAWGSGTASELTQRHRAEAIKKAKQSADARERARKKTGTEGKLKRTMRAMFESMDPCNLHSVMAELEADAREKESVLTELREQGRAFIIARTVTADRIEYDEIGGKAGKALTPHRLDNILSEIRNA